MRARTNISRKERQHFAISDFAGADFSNSPQKVQTNRASDMRNFIKENGVIKKRNGWRQIFSFDSTTGRSNINGIAKYKNGDYECLIVYVGKSFYRIIEGEEPELILFEKDFEDSRVQFFMNNKRMYIIGCGEYLVYGTWDDGKTYELRRVADDVDTYVPTTTISIDNEKVENDRRATLDDVNLLCSRRTNGLVGAEIPEGENFLDWRLDANVKKGKVEIRAEMLNREEIEVEVTTQNNTEDDSGESSEAGEDTETGENTESSEVGETCIFYQDRIIEKYWVCESEDCYRDYGLIYEVKTNEASGETEKDHIATIFWGTNLIRFFTSTLPPIENHTNIYVTFYPNIEEEEFEAGVKKVSDCKFGTLFGVDGKTDRLFLAGNPNFQNVDFYSEETDFTYFSDLNYVAVGSDEVPIVGYGKLSDSMLAIYKAENAYEPTIYTRSGYYDTEYDSDGNIDTMRGVFSHQSGGIAEACINSYTASTFDGDPIILSKNGVFGIVLPENLSSTERYTKNRSANIQKRLMTHDLKNAVGISYNNRYYLAVDGVCYVADARYKTEAADAYDNSYGYEWWLWDNVPACVWAVIDGELYFGTKWGKICVFDAEYTDRNLDPVKTNEITLKFVENTGTATSITAADYIINKLNENDTIIFDSEIYSLMASKAEIIDGKIKDSNNIYFLNEGDVVFVDNCKSEKLSPDTSYEISDIDIEKCTYSLRVAGAAEEIMLSKDDAGFNIYKNLRDEELYITNIMIEENSNSFQLKKYRDTEETLVLSRYNNTTPINVTAKIVKSQNVVAEWCTPALDFGTSEMSKTLLKMTVSAEGKLRFGYETRHTNKLIDLRGTETFSFEDFSFNAFSFDTGFANSYSVKCNERNFNYIMFKFISDSASDCRINSFSAIYKFNKSNKGVT